MDWKCLFGSEGDTKHVPKKELRTHAPPTWFTVAVASSIHSRNKKALGLRSLSPRSLNAVMSALAWISAHRNETLTENPVEMDAPTGGRFS